MQEFTDKSVGATDHRTTQKRLQYLDEQNRALVSIQDKLERLSDFRSDMILSHDIPEILQSGIAKFQELVKTEACSVFLVDENGFEFRHEISIPEHFAQLMEKELDAQIMSGTFGWIINSGHPACVPTEVFGKGDHRKLSVMIAPLSNKERTLGAVSIVFEQDEDFIRQQTLKLLYILSSFFSLSLENAYLFEDLKKSYFDTIRAVANSVEARDAYTRGHSNRVAEISKIIAAEMGWGRRDLEMIDWGGVLHDLGKVGISDSILNKPGKLTDEEFAIMKSHPSIGAQIIGGIAFLEPLMPYIAQHHERYDGRGYPAGFKGEEIAIQGRLLAIADTYDAMTSDRPYRKGLAAQIAYDEILKCTGTQFDPVLVRAFEKAFKAGKIV
ncbi:MAG TPA: HD domain-containing phosphohydrolase [Syntrophales bacterium]|jgi:putative nucleotidyltransferase with HDIG domain